MIGIVIIGAAALAQVAATPTAPAVTKPDLGLCVRWGASDTQHLADAVMVDGTGNAEADRKIVARFKADVMSRPAGYGGQWMPIALSATPGRTNLKMPDCAKLAKGN